MLTNPRKRRRNSRRRRKSNPSVSRHSRRRNSHFGFRRRRSHRNPSLKFGGFDLKTIIKLGAGAAAGALGTRAGTQLVLQGNNSGPVGYVGNGVVALGLGWLAAKFAGKEVGIAVATGGIAALILRVWSEKVSMTSPAAAVSGLGDVDFSVDGLGAYVNNGYALPSISSPQNGYLVTQPPFGAGVSAASASGAGTSSVPVQVSGTRFGKRF